MQPPLFAPWRMEYIRSLEKAGSGCFLCGLATLTEPNQRRDALLLWDTPLSVVVMNRYPYTNGHLLVAPKAHKADLTELSREELLDVSEQTVKCERLLKRAVSAQGFNLGMNLGRVAGAGVPGHLHQHIVPRWNGDNNFISVVGETRVLPQAMSQLYDELMGYLPELDTK